jgi:ribosomal protein S18 acetylase RimI-like enzyme
VNSDGKITLRPVEAADEEFLVAVYRSTRQAELAHVPWRPEQKAAFVRAQFAAQKQHYAREYPAASHEVICLGDTAVGRVYLARNADALHVLDITILPEHRNRGIGSTVLRRIMEEAQASGKPVTIYAESFNPSLHLFRKLGFEQVSENGFHYLLRWTPTV